MMNERTAVDVKAGIAELMAILEGAKMKDVTVKFEKGVVKAAPKKRVVSVGNVGGEIVKKAIAGFVDGAYVREVHEEEEVVAEKGTLIERGMITAVDGKSLFTGSKKKGKGGAKGPKADAARDAIKAIYTAAVTGHAVLGKGMFTHSTEGLIIRLEEADYAIKISRSNEPKIDATEKGFTPERDFSTRGKAKNSAAAIAKMLFTEFENQISNLEFGFAIVSAKASGIVLQGAAGEYTVKISKKRDRVGFEAERASSYEK